MKNKILSTLLFLAMLTSSTSLFSQSNPKDDDALLRMSAANNSPSRVIGNEYIEFSVNNTGKYTIGTTSGDPEKPTDDNKKLLYGHPHSDTTYTTIAVDGSYFKYNIDEPALFDEVLLRSTSKMTINNDIKVQQVLTIIENSSTLRKDLVEIKYIVTNMGSEAKNVGARIMLDTMLGDNDAAPFKIPEIGGQTTEIEFAGMNIPHYWQAFDSLVTPKVVAQGTFKTDGLDPDKVQFVNWRGIYNKLWDYTVTPGKNNGDSAVSVTWEENILEPGAVKEFKTYYGLSSIQGIVEPPLALKVTAVKRLDINNTMDDYFPNPFIATAYIANISDVLPPNVTAEDVSVKINLPSGLTLVGGDSVIDLGIMTPGNEKQRSWQIKAEHSPVDTTLTFSVEVDYAGSNPSIFPLTVEKEIIIPALIIDKPYEYAVFSGHPIQQIAYSGRNHDVKGNIHTNNVLSASGWDINLDGDCSAGTAIFAIPGVNILNPVLGVPYVETADFNDEIENQIASATVKLTGDQVIELDGTTTNDSYFVDGDVVLNLNNSQGPSYIIATGSITIQNISNTTQNLVNSGDIVYASLNGDIDITVGGAELTGIVYSRNGSIDISGSNLTVNGSLVADKSVNISGDNIDVINN